MTEFRKLSKKFNVVFDLNISLQIFEDIFSVGLKQIRLPDISPAKMGLLRINRELQFSVSDPGEPHASPHIAREGEHFYRLKEEIRSQS